MGRLSNICALFLTLAMAVPALGQTQDGSVSGSVRDEQGASVPGTDVAVQGIDVTHHFTTGSDGGFRFLNLQPGPYTITATLQGFQPVEPRRHRRGRRDTSMRRSNCAWRR